MWDRYEDDQKIPWLDALLKLVIAKPLGAQGCDTDVRETIEQQIRQKLDGESQETR
jgi:hypothetical protein